MALGSGMVAAGQLDRDHSALRGSRTARTRRSFITISSSADSVISPSNGAWEWNGGSRATGPGSFGAARLSNGAYTPLIHYNQQFGRLGNLAFEWRLGVEWWQQGNWTGIIRRCAALERRVHAAHSLQSAVRPTR